MKKLIILIIFCFEFLNADVVVIASPTCKVEVLSIHNVKKLFMIKKRSINNEKIIVLDNPDKEVYEIFLNKYLKKSPRKMKVYWVRMLFTGKKVAPKKFLFEDFSSLTTNNSCYLTYVEEENKPNDWKFIKIK